MTMMFAMCDGRAIMLGAFPHNLMKGTTSQKGNGETDPRTLLVRKVPLEVR